MGNSGGFQNRKAFVTGVEKVEFFSEKLHLTADKNVIIKIHSSALCGGDKKAYTGEHPFVDFPVAIGHEFAGEIVARGREVKKLFPGARVVVEPAVNCGRCSACQKGSYNFCNDLTFLYRKGKAGMAQYIEVSAEKVYQIPDSLTYEEAALIEPLAVAVHAWQKFFSDFKDRVAIIGCGTIGILLAQLALVSGVQEVAILGINEFKLELARELGVNLAVNNKNEKEAQKLNNRYNQVFEAVGLNKTFSQALSLAGSDGKIILLGLYKDDITVEMNCVIQKELKLSGSQGYCWNFEEALDLVERGKVQLKPLITHKYRLEEIDQALQTAVNPSQQAIKVICNM